jgi:hypothetical protein
VGTWSRLERPARTSLRGGATRLYRAVSDAEFDDIIHSGFRPDEGTMETKLFTTSADLSLPAALQQQEGDARKAPQDLARFR